MGFKSFVTLLTLLGLVSAHFQIEYPYWRGDSFAAGRSQWTFPCAGVNETTDIKNRTQWPTTGGSIRLHVSHPWALTYVNLGIGTNVSSFNISLVTQFNQTGNGTFCLKETGKAALAAGLAKSGLDAKSLDGKQASLQIIQIASTGASLFNCADITFNATAALLPDNECSNSTGVSGVGIVNAGSQTIGGSPNATTSAGATKSSGAAAVLKPAGLLAAVVGVAVGMM
ncbi:uncharacterized protein BDR25DRAFT_258783 [Lindgomyces ingoldianus]|uniref:Uncharacterized protein n=1 Tax=Lindgomyces ingoldianus TaxID=673940 RepID=A0ACB6R269_9PLEO|nr:uncharacterized protein BDR25DRAFT_258783 [Lindgomyces ingoldianus]KAF2472432.1 hypothetical protein BDR25DRAFT_258783 [Lindgomyces ingoldianus]